MRDYNPKTWCQANGWTEARQLEDGIWVAFPPGGFIETPLPHQFPQAETEYKVSLFTTILDSLVLIFLVLLGGAIAIVIFPFFMIQIIRHRHVSVTNFES
jgi:hypothetical protein